MHGREPGVISAAEESTAWPGVSQPTYLGGLGFGFKWNMGWMHDTLDYFRRDPIHRRYHHHQLTFSLMYAFSENFVLPLSHDEVVHGKGSLLAKMPGDRWQQFANLRSLYAYMWAHPGKKLLFMGGELAQEQEWSHDRSLDWHLLEQPEHAGVQQLVRDAQPRSTASTRRSGRSTTSRPASAGSSRTTRRATSSPSRATASSDAAARLRLQPLARGARGLPRRLPRRRPLGRGAQHRLDLLRRQRRRQPRRRRGRARRLARPAVLGRADAAAARRSSGSCPRLAGNVAPVLGAVPRDEKVADFEVWAPAASSLAVRVNGDEHALARDEEGFWRGEAPARHGDDYCFVARRRRACPTLLALAAGRRARPFARARHGAVRPRAPVRARARRARALRAARRHVHRRRAPSTRRSRTWPRLRELGVTAIEVMPVATFPGTRGWGYDGLYTSAPHQAYGGPGGVRALRRRRARRGARRRARRRLQPRRPRQRGVARVRPVLHRPPRDVLGRRARLLAARRARVGDPERGASGCATTTSTGSGSTRRTRSSTTRRVTCSPSSPTACARSSRARSSPRRWRPGDLRPIEEWGHDAQWADELHHELHVAPDRRARRLLRGLRLARRPRRAAASGSRPSA